MSAAVSLSSKLPGEDDTNGLDSIAADLVGQPGEIRCAVVWYDVAKTVHNTDTQRDVPTVRIRRVEPVTGELQRTVVAAAETAFSQRTGRNMLPLDGVEPGDGQQ